MHLIALPHVHEQVRASFPERYHELSSKIHDVAAAVAEVRSPLIGLDWRNCTAALALKTALGHTLGSLPSMQVLTTAPFSSPQVRSSRALKAVLEHTLALGNYLNGSSAKGGAWGFKIDSLNKLIGTKTVDGSSTLLHYLARELAAKVR